MKEDFEVHRLGKDLFSAIPVSLTKYSPKNLVLCVSLGHQGYSTVITEVYFHY